MVARHYAGIGSRETPKDVLFWMVKIARRLAADGWTLRSGGAEGADSSFQCGAVLTSGPYEIFTANDATPEAIAHAEQYHPAWHLCGEMGRKLHGRNSMIVLGRDLMVPVKMVVCWTPQAKAIGGTGQALRIAAAERIPVKNLADPEVMATVQKWLQSEATSKDART